MQAVEMSYFFQHFKSMTHDDLHTLVGRLDDIEAKIADSGDKQKSAVLSEELISCTFLKVFETS
jgi:hypothetical protein